MRDSFTVITFIFNGAEHVMDNRMGPSRIEITALLAEIAEHFQDDDLKKRGWFIRKLIDVGLEGVTLISVEEKKVEKKKI